MRYFELTYDSNPSGRFTTGYWSCYAEPGYDGAGITVEAAMGECIQEMSKALVEIQQAEREAMGPVRKMPQA